MTGVNAKAVLSGEIYDRASSQTQPAGVGSTMITTNQPHEGSITMSDNNKSLGQQYHEAVEALKAQGVSNADAIRQVAETHGKQENAVRGGIHQYKRTNVGNGAAPTRNRRQPSPSVDDYLSSARQALENALRLIDSEVDDAKEALDAAQTRYDEVVAAVGERKADIERKLVALA